MLQLTPFVCFAAALSALPNLPPSTSSADTLPRLNLVWSDSHRLFPYGFQPMVDEVEEIFNAVGVDAQMGKVVVSQELDCFEIVVYLRASPPVGWELSDGAMGAVVPGRHPRRTVYIFLQNVLRTLALDYNPTARLPSATETRVLARALARVVSHEIVHSVAPEAPHSLSGLMQARLTKAHLTKTRLVLSPRSTEALLSGLEKSVRAGDLDKTVMFLEELRWVQGPFRPDAVFPQQTRGSVRLPWPDRELDLPDVVDRRYPRNLPDRRRHRR